MRASALVMIIALCACGGDASYTSGRYADPEASYRIGEPGSGWSRIDVEGQNDLAWTNGDLGAVIQVNASCDPALDIPLTALRNHLLIGLTEREVLSEDTIPFAEREALRTRLYAKLDGVRRELLLQILKKDGCVYDFALVAPPGSQFERALGDYDALLSQFETEGR